MKARTSVRLFAVLLALAMLPGLLAGCTRKDEKSPKPDGQDARELVTVAALEVEAVCGASWRQVFGDRTLPEEGWLKPDEVGFIRYEEDGTEVVTVMSLAEIDSYLADLGNLPRSRYLENLADVEDAGLLFKIFDMAFALGSRKFAFPTATLRAKDAASLLDHLENTYQSAGFGPQFSVTKDLTDGQGSKFHFLTVQLTGFTQQDMDKHCQAVEMARSIVDEMPSALDELGKAKYLYRYVCSTVKYYTYEERPAEYYGNEGWNALYDALVNHDTVCQGYAEAVSTLFNLAGIDCLTVSGPVVAADISVDSHAWNVAKVNGQWYIFDATWDNTDQGKHPYRPLFFGISQELANHYMMRRPFSFWEGIVPACNEILDPSYIYYVEDPQF